ncbi:MULTISPECIES: hypothetical protein [unclassified Endozoicomonas]
MSGHAVEKVHRPCEAVYTCKKLAVPYRQQPKARGKRLPDAY